MQIFYKKTLSPVVFLEEHDKSRPCLTFNAILKFEQLSKLANRIKMAIAKFKMLIQKSRNMLIKCLSRNHSSLINQYAK